MGLSKEEQLTADEPEEEQLTKEWYEADVPDEVGLELNNLDFWNTVEETDPNHTKVVAIGGRKFTAIDAYYQIKTATEMWGQYGSTWGLFDIEYVPIKHTPIMHLRANFKYPNMYGTMVAFPISTAVKMVTGKGQFDADFAKKAETSLISKSLSRLGYNADVFLGKFEDNVYVDELKAEYTLTYTEEQKEKFDQLIKNSNALDFFIFVKSLTADVYTSLYNSFPRGQKVKMKDQCNRLEADGKEVFDQYLEQMIERIEYNDKDGLLELKDEVGDMAAEIIFRAMDNTHQITAHNLFQT